MDGDIGGGFLDFSYCAPGQWTTLQNLHDEPNSEPDVGKGLVLDADDNGVFDTHSSTFYFVDPCAVDRRLFDLFFCQFNCQKSGC